MVRTGHVRIDVHPSPDRDINYISDVVGLVRLCSLAPCSPAEVRAFGQLRARGVALAVLGDVRGAGARGVQTLDDAAVGARDLAVDGRAHPAEREAGV